MQIRTPQIVSVVLVVTLIVTLSVGIFAMSSLAEGPKTNEAISESIGPSSGVNDNTPPSVYDIVNTLALVDPTTETEDEVVDADPESPGVQVQIEGTEVVSNISFSDKNAAGSIVTNEYIHPPEQIKTDVSASISGDIETYNDVSTISVINITHDDEADQDAGATVELTVSTQRVDNPDKLTIIKEKYDFQQQESIWVEAETTVMEVGDDKITVSAEIDEFSLLAVTEIETGDVGNVVKLNHSEPIHSDGDFDITVETADSAGTVLEVEPEGFEVDLSTSEDNAVQITDNQVQFLDVSADESEYTVTVDVIGGSDGDVGDIAAWVNAEQKSDASDIQELSFELEQPDPPAIDSVNVTSESPTNDKIVVKTSLKEGDVGIDTVTAGVNATFTDFSMRESDSSVSDNREFETIIPVEELPADGKYTAIAKVEYKTGQTVDAQGDSVDVDTTPPALQLGVKGLKSGESADLTVIGDQKFNITSLDIENRTEVIGTPSTPIGPQTEFTESFDNDGSEFNITVEAEDEVGNTVTETMTAAVSNYKVENGNAKVSTPDEYVQFELNANKSIVTDGEEREAISTTSDTLPAGTTAADNQIIGGVVDVSDIGLDQDELETATIRLSVNDVPDRVTDSFDTNELLVMRSEEGKDTYTPVEETNFDSDTNELVVTVDGFSQYGVGKVDNTPPSIDTTTVTPGTDIKPSDGPVTIKFEYSPQGTNINLSSTDVSVDDADDSQIDTIQVTDTYAEVMISDLKDGDSPTVTIDVVDEAGNKKTESVSVDVESESSDSNDNNGGGSSGGGGGGGASASGGGDPTSSGPPTPAQVASTAGLVEPRSETTIEGTDTSGVETVTSVTTNSGDAFSVELAEYGNPPQTLERDIIDSVAGFSSKIAPATAEVAKNGDATTKSGDNATVVLFAEIEPTTELADGDQAKITFSVDQDAVDSGELTVYKTEYVFEAQETEWIETETNVEAVDDSLEVTATIDRFSQFAVLNVDTDNPEPSTRNKSERPQTTDDDTPGFGIVAICVSLLGVVGILVTQNGLFYRDE